MSWIAGSGLTTCRMKHLQLAYVTSSSGSTKRAILQLSYTHSLLHRSTHIALHQNRSTPRPQRQHTAAIHCSVQSQAVGLKSLLHAMIAACKKLQHVASILQSPMCACLSPI